jgi:two-component system, NtrC family, response regulator HydG
MAPILGKVLIIDDDESSGNYCRTILESSGHSCSTVKNGAQALEHIRQESFDAALLELNTLDKPSVEVLKKLREESPNTAVIILSGQPTIDSAVETIKLGAFHYLSKPFSPETLSELVERAIRTVRRVLENSCIHLELERKMLSQALIGRSQAMNRVVRLIQKAAPTDSTVLITGETGAGKEVVARAIHRLSRRSQKPFVTIDCGTLVESLFESELFGHAKGSFTGAVENAIGKFELADGGTLFLDEISNITLGMQARLLRAVQEHEITPIGSTQKKKIDVRIISATNRDLPQEVRQGKFREDLFYRLNVIHIPVPPLRDRLEDIPALTDYYLNKLSLDKGGGPPSVSDEVLRYLKRQDWPGNVRELINALEYAVVTSEGKTIGVRDLPQADQLSMKSESFPGGSLARLEYNEILNALNHYRGNKTKTADHLGINRKTLREKMQKYGISSTENSR